MSTMEAIAKLIELTEKTGQAIKITRGLHLGMDAAKVMEEVGEVQKADSVVRSLPGSQSVRLPVDSDIIIPNLFDKAQDVAPIPRDLTDAGDSLSIPPAWMLGQRGRGGAAPLETAHSMPMSGDVPMVRDIKFDPLDAPPKMEAISWFGRGDKSKIVQPLIDEAREPSGLDPARYGENRILSRRPDGRVQIEISKPPAENPDFLEPGSVLEMYPKGEETHHGIVHSMEIKPYRDPPTPLFDAQGRLIKVTTTNKTGAARIEYHGDTKIPKEIELEDGAIIRIPVATEKGPVRTASLAEAKIDPKTKESKSGEPVGIRFRSLTPEKVQYEKVEGPQRMLIDRFFKGGWDMYPMENGVAKPDLAHYNRPREGRELVYRNSDKAEPKNQFIAWDFAKGDEINQTFGDGILDGYPGVKAEFVAVKQFHNQSQHFVATDRSSLFEAGGVMPTLRIGSQDPQEFHSVFRREDGLAVYTDKEGVPTMIYPSEGSLVVARRGEHPYTVHEVKEVHPDGLPTGDTIASTVDISPERTRYDFPHLVMDVNHKPVQQIFGGVTKSLYPRTTIPGTTSSTFGDVTHVLDTTDGTTLHYYQYAKSRVSLDEPLQPQKDPQGSNNDGYYITADGRAIPKAW